MGLEFRRLLRCAFVHFLMQITARYDLDGITLRSLLSSRALFTNGCCHMVGAFTATYASADTLVTDLFMVASTCLDSGR